MCGCQHDVLQRDQLGRHPRLVLVDVERGGGQAADPQGAATSAPRVDSPPRGVLTRIAPGLKRASAAASIRCASRADSGTCNVTKSASATQVVERQRSRPAHRLGVTREV